MGIYAYSLHSKSAYVCEFRCYFRKKKINTRSFLTVIIYNNRTILNKILSNKTAVIQAMTLIAIIEEEAKKEIWEEFTNGVMF